MNALHLSDYYVGCIYVVPYLGSFAGFTSCSSEIVTWGCPWGCLEMLHVVEILCYSNQREQKGRSGWDVRLQKGGRSHPSICPRPSRPVEMDVQVSVCTQQGAAAVWTASAAPRGLLGRARGAASVRWESCFTNGALHCIAS